MACPACYCGPVENVAAQAQESTEESCPPKTGLSIEGPVVLVPCDLAFEKTFADECEATRQFTSLLPLLLG